MVFVRVSACAGKVIPWTVWSIINCVPSKPVSHVAALQGCTLFDDRKYFPSNCIYEKPLLSHFIHFLYFLNVSKCLHYSGRPGARTVPCPGISTCSWGTYVRTDNCIRIEWNAHGSWARVEKRSSCDPVLEAPKPTIRPMKSPP